MLELNNFLEIIIPERLPAWAVAIKIFLIAFSLLLLAGIVYFSIFTDYFYYKYFEALDDWYEFKRRKKEKESKKRKMEAKISFVGEEKKEEVQDNLWERISKRIKEGRDIGLKMALIDADKLVNQKLEEMGCEGRDLREKIKNLDKKTLPNLGELEKARELLEEVLSEKREVKKDEIGKAIDTYKKAYDHLTGKFAK
ncbi:MAG: hypothetical protein LR000_00310 [Candidatus Pacebacteria bacterium]|nr:hypothetical protein [Candidatus Paceibacterota bacterium]